MMTETTAEHRERMAVCDRLKKELADAATHRSEREDLITRPFGTEPGWVMYERHRMGAAVNAERAARGLPPVTLRAIERLESLCVGHSDYAAKFALYCSELVFAERLGINTGKEA